MLGGIIVSLFGTSGAKAQAPILKGFNEYPITFWWGPPSAETNEARYKEIARAGFNLAGPPASDKPGQYADFFDPKLNRKVLDYCQKFGMKGLVADKRINQILSQNGDVNILVDSVVAEYKDHPALWGYQIMDEPGIDPFPKLGHIVARMREKDPKHVAYINLFPNYVPLELIKVESYREYLERYVKEVKPDLICYDHYHFMQSGKVAEKPASFINEQAQVAWEAAQSQSTGNDREGFFNNLEVVREVAKEHHLPFMVVVLLTTHGGYRDLTEAELRWEAFQCLAYGSSALSWFTYWAPPDENVWHFRHAIFNWNGERTDHYDHVKRINTDLIALGNRLMGRESLAVFHVGNEADHDVKPFAPFGAVQSISGEPLTVGIFEDGYVLLANKNYRQPTMVTISLSAGTKVKLFERMRNKERILKVKNNTITITLQPGDAELICLN